MIGRSVGLQTHIWNNNLLSLAVLFILPVILMAFVWALIAAWYAYGIFHDEPFLQAWNLTIGYVHYIILVALVWYIIAWGFHSDIILKATGAKSVDRRDEKRLYNLLENLAITRKMAMPKLAIIETPALNAFASGIDKNSYRVTVTRGLLDTLNNEELEAVLAHELSHIENNDVRLMMVITIFAGMIGTITALSMAYLFPMRKKDDEKTKKFSFSSLGRKRSGGHVALFIIAAALIAFIASSLVKLVKLYISRKREYMADAQAVKMTNNPVAMARALRKIESQSSMPRMPGLLAEMCIAPMSLSDFFSTHPTTEQRITAIRRYAGRGMSESEFQLPQKETKQEISPDLLSNPSEGSGSTVRQSEIPTGTGQKSKTHQENQQTLPGPFPIPPVPFPVNTIPLPNEVHDRMQKIIQQKHHHNHKADQTKPLTEPQKEFHGQVKFGKRRSPVPSDTNHS